ncbi:MAG: GTP 3',8-cyclase MoaA [Thermoproteales archaeon]|nr:GTP 3',8-cyclase MoaA [Thermoproteales archaeon]
MVLKDRFNRYLTHLRISVTMKCNYDCIYCHREGETFKEDFLRVRDIGIVCKAATLHGIKYYKITGGEPLVRSDILEIVSVIKENVSGEISMTTNGYFLEDYIPAILDAGLKRVNVSLPSLKESNYLRITKRKGLNKVLRGLDIAVSYGVPIKLNVVVTKYNFNELTSIIEYASSKGFDINLIELIPVNISPEIFRDLYVSIDGVEKEVMDKAKKRYIRDLQARPVYVLDTGVKIEFIKSFCNPIFCNKCSKIRLTHDGFLKPCIMRNDNVVDIRSILRADFSDDKKILMIYEKIKETNMKREPYFRYRGNKCVSVDGRYIRER